eukprot:TRINITY_DN4707_c0_g1_i2.p1 TRINITY_DN4707_c0_g1~~TRINITY_DN4707_c0_g1_i2.p1  ORF type:complete len:173 (+),score=11.80 TRINITY_DN4707_c0_g1_i2:296-814(+)
MIGALNYEYFTVQYTELITNACLSAGLGMMAMNGVFLVHGLFLKSRQSLKITLPYIAMSIGMVVSSWMMESFGLTTTMPMLSGFLASSVAHSFQIPESRVMGRSYQTLLRYAMPIMLFMTILTYQFIMQPIRYREMTDELQKLQRHANEGTTPTPEPTPIPTALTPKLAQTK